MIEDYFVIDDELKLPYYITKPPRIIKTVAIMTAAGFTKVLDPSWILSRVPNPFLQSLIRAGYTYEELKIKHLKIEITHEPAVAGSLDLTLYICMLNGEEWEVLSLYLMGLDQVTIEYYTPMESKLIEAMDKIKKDIAAKHEQEQEQEKAQSNG